MRLVDRGVSAEIHAVMDLTTSHTLSATFWRAWVGVQDVATAVDEAVKEEK